MAIWIWFGCPIFLSTPSARRATQGSRLQRRWRSYFYPRPPRGGRLNLGYIQTMQDVISIHALREEGDLTGCTTKASILQFLSTPSARRATRIPRSMGRIPDISIHALREEGDLNHSCHIIAYALFLSTPSARRATTASGTLTKISIFLSTPSARRATCSPPTRGRPRSNFYPRPPRGGRHAA